MKNTRKPTAKAGATKPSRSKSTQPATRRPVPPLIPALSEDSLLAFLETQRDGKTTKDEIIAHFALSGQQHVALRHLIQDMADKGVLQKNTKQIVALSDSNPDRTTTPSGMGSFTGIFNSQRRGGGVIQSIQRKDKTTITVLADDTLDAKDGDLVEVKNSKVVRIIASRNDAGFVSLLAIRNFNVPDTFSPEIIAETEGQTVPPLGQRTDLRDLPLVTIDGEDARDFDDAVHAILDEAADNVGGWVITVAIADVSHYVRPGSALDEEALKRGNSLYFPDRVVPMLPEALSNGLCSLRPDEERACMAIIMRVNRQGHMIEQKIVRGLMKSVARLTYTQVQEALDGKLDATTKPLLADVIMPLFGAYKTLLHARHERGTIDLDVPERKIELKNGVVAAIHQRERYDSHKLIEEMMILANVAAATLLEEKHQPLLYRAHAKPDPMRLESTRNFLKEFGYRLKTGTSLSPKDFRQILQQTSGHDEAPLINEIMLRTMSQAEYSPFNVGHFGLALERYAHFTSPIRRYADLIVHRALIKAYKLGDDGLTELEQNKLPQIAEHISERERVAQSAERETIDRYVALYLQDKIGNTFDGRISGVTKAGLFITLDETGADGLLPMRMLPRDYYEHDEQRHMLIGQRNGQIFRLAGRVRVDLLETDSVTGRLVLQLAGTEQEATPRFRRHPTDPSSQPDRRDERNNDRDRGERKPYPRRDDGGRPPRSGGRDGSASHSRSDNFGNGERRLMERENDARRDAERERRNSRDGAPPRNRDDRPFRDGPPSDRRGPGDRSGRSFDRPSDGGGFGDRKPRGGGGSSSGRDGGTSWRSGSSRGPKPPSRGGKPGGFGPKRGR